MSELLVEVARGGRVESRHCGSIAVVDVNGKQICHAGDSGMSTYFRSAAKPIQAMNAILSGAADKFSLTHSEIAIMCGSHYAEDFHRKTVLGILEKLGLDLSALKSPPAYSIKYAQAIKQAGENRSMDQADSNCSGKHCGFLAASLAQGYPLESYCDPSHPVQKEVVSILSAMCGIGEGDIGIGVDGCGVPVHYMSLCDMALSYARLANPVTLPADYAGASRIIFGAMNAAPEMVAGTGGFCTELIAATNGKLIAKLGAEAVYCVGVREQGIGIAVKIDDGLGTRALNAAVMSTLLQLEIIGDGELKKLERFAHPQNINGHGDIVGEITPVFKLKSGPRP